MTFVRGFVRRWGWRAYALPVLAVVTVVVLLGNTPGNAEPRATGTTHTTTPTSAVHSEGDKAGTSYSPAVTPKPVVLSVTEDDATTCSDNQYAQLVVVSIKSQHLWACDGHQQVDSTPVTTGSTDNGDNTPLGSWRVQAKQRDRYLVGPGYKDYVQYWVPFNGDFGLHDASWQTMPFGSQDYHTQGSHGCVHLPTPTMAWLYSWVKVNKTVVTIEA